MTDDKMDMTDPFHLAFIFTPGRSEGGYVDDPADHGGSTYRGVTQRTYDRYRISIGLPTRDVREMTEAEERRIYKTEYWVPAHCPDLLFSTKLAVAHYDWAVNHGPVGAIESLQRLVGVKMDGVFGPRTKAAVLSAKPGLVWRYLTYRRQWYKRDVTRNKSQEKFLQGWLNRVDNLENYLRGLDDGKHTEGPVDG